MKTRKLISFFFLFFLTLNICSYISIRVYYQSEKEHITTVFCVNKNDSTLQCNGQCHLKKLIQKVSHDQNDNKLSIVDNLLHVYTSSLPFAYELPQFSSYYKKNNRIAHNFTFLYKGYLSLLGTLYKGM